MIVGIAVGSEEAVEFRRDVKVLKYMMVVEDLSRVRIDKYQCGAQFLPAGL